MLLLTRRDIDRILDEVGIDRIMADLIDRLGDSFRRVYCGSAQLSPARGGFDRKDPVRGVIEWMPHREAGCGTTIKVVSYSPANTEKFGLPTITACIARFDDCTGHTTAIAEGGIITALRTGAASALASRALAYPESRVVGIVGCGAQAVTQLHGLSLLFPLNTVLAWDTNPVHLASFAKRTAFTGLKVVHAEPGEIVGAADIIVTATSVEVGAGPVIPDGAIRQHLHINAIGSDVIGKTELPRALLDRALVATDHPEQALREGESQVLDRQQLGPTLSEICADPRAVEEARLRLTVFDSTGVAMEDHVAFDLFVELAGQLGIGSQVTIESAVIDTLNPYAAVRHRNAQPTLPTRPHSASDMPHSHSWSRPAPRATRNPT